MIKSRNATTTSWCIGLVSVLSRGSLRLLADRFSWPVGVDSSASVSEFRGTGRSVCGAAGSGSMAAILAGLLMSPGRGQCSFPTWEIQIPSAGGLILRKGKQAERTDGVQTVFQFE